jgi:DNA-binding transcriptional MerR regulator
MTEFPWEEWEQEAEAEDGGSGEAGASAEASDAVADSGEAPAGEAVVPDATAAATDGAGADEAEAHAAQPDAGASAERDEAGAAARRPSATRPVARKEYYSIGEVADLVGLPAHVLRYWESQFSVLNPSKNRSGNRAYQRKEIRLILLVKQLLHEEKYTVEGAKQKLDQLRRGGDLQDATTRALDEQMLRVLREDLRELSELLGPGPA